MKAFEKDMLMVCGVEGREVGIVSVEKSEEKTE